MLAPSSPSTLMAKLDGLAAQHVEQVEQNIADLQTADIQRVTISVGEWEVGHASYQVETHSG